MSEEIKSAWQAILAAGILGGVLGALMTSILTHRLTSYREKRSGIKAEKLRMIPMLDGYILSTRKGGSCVYRLLFFQSRRELFEPAMRFRVHLKKGQAIKFDLVWNSFYNTNADDIDNQPDISPAESDKRQQKLLFMLESIRTFVSES